MSVLQISGCLIATGVVGLTTAVVGRFAGVALTVVISGMMAFFMTPIFSLRVDRSTDIAALAVQSVAGIVVTQTAHRRSSRRQIKQKPGLATAERPPMPRRILESSRLADVVPQLLEKYGDLRLRSADLSVEVDQCLRLTLSESELCRILSDIFRLAFARTNVRRVSTFASRRPSCERISVAAEYDNETTVPRLRILGRNDDHCRQVLTSNWPQRCSATWFDNGFAYIYQVAIQRPEDSTADALAVEVVSEPVTSAVK